MSFEVIVNQMNSIPAAADGEISEILPDTVFPTRGISGWGHARPLLIQYRDRHFFEIEEQCPSIVCCFEDNKPAQC